MTVVNGSIPKRGGASGWAVVLAAAALVAPQPGVWACRDTSGALHFSLTLDGDGAYRDADDLPAGRFTVDGATRRITFAGGFLDGRTGTDAEANSFLLSDTLRCAPW